MDTQPSLHKLMEKIKAAQASGKLDLSTEEDLSIAIMNLISIEEHCFFTAEKTGKPEYLNLLHEVRSMRTRLLGSMVTQTEGEAWCISKHLLAASMRLIEVGTKHKKEGRDEEAETSFHDAYRLYTLFWTLRLHLMNPQEIITNVADDTKNVGDTSASDRWTKQELVSKLVDCCEE